METEPGVPSSARGVIHWESVCVSCVGPGFDPNISRKTFKNHALRLADTASRTQEARSAE